MKYKQIMGDLHYTYVFRELLGTKNTSMFSLLCPET